MCMMTICINMDLSHESKLNFKPTYPKCLALVKCTILLSDVNNGEGYACIGGKVISYSSVLSSQFYCKPKQIKS